VIVLAQNDARELGHAAIMPAHVLLALAEEAEGVAARAMATVGAEPQELRRRVADAFDVSPGRKEVGRLPFSPKAKKVLELSLRESLQLGHGYIGTEHLLLGVLRLTSTDEPQNDDLFGLPVKRLRQAVIATISGARHGERLSPALAQAMDRGRALAGRDPMTTGHLLTAMLEDAANQATKALASLGMSRDAVAGAVSRIPAGESSDAAPPRSFEVKMEKMGELTLRVSDPDLVAKLSSATPEQLLAALRRLAVEPGADG
jgi:ATP-dependent Clp protease ATP-binding subunit ClpA